MLKLALFRQELPFSHGRISRVACGHCRSVRELTWFNQQMDVTPLHNAALGGHEIICRLLIEMGANINATGEIGETPLHKAALKGNETICKFLIENGANINATDDIGCMPLHYAAAAGYETICKLLIEKGTNINAASNEFGVTPLHKAALKGKETICKFLIENGANINATDDIGCMPLHYAAGGGYETICKLLIEKGTNINAVSKKFGRTPLHWAALGGYEAICKLLLEKGANYQVKDIDGETALDLARSTDTQKVGVSSSKDMQAIVQLLESWAANDEAGFSRPDAQEQMLFLDELLGSIDLRVEIRTKYKALFIKHNITSPKIFSLLDREAIEKIGIVSVGHQLMLESAIKERFSSYSVNSLEADKDEAAPAKLAPTESSPQEYHF